MNRISELRKKAGLTQREAANSAGWEHQSRWSSYERGVRKPTPEDVKSIVKVLRESGIDCCFEDLFPDSAAA